MDINVWFLEDATIFIGGDPTKNKPPFLTVKLKAPQIIIDKEKNQAIIIEGK